MHAGSILKHILLVLLFVMQARNVFADGLPDIRLITHVNSISGDLKDGTHLAEGRIITRSGGSGFHVWINTTVVGQSHNHYMIEGSISQKHRLYVRLEKNGWEPDDTEKGGLRYTGNTNSEKFYIVVDGDQHVEPDQYHLIISGDVIHL